MTRLGAHLVHAASATVLACSASLALAALPEGAKAPDFELKAALAGKPMTFSLAKARRQGPVVLYFFPAAFTQGCSVEAHEFAEATDDCVEEALFWFSNYPLAVFDYKTGHTLAAERRTEAVLRYLASLDAGFAG